MAIGNGVSTTPVGLPVFHPRGPFRVRLCEVTSSRVRGVGEQQRLVTQWGIGHRRSCCRLTIVEGENPCPVLTLFLPVLFASRV